ncbi:MAG: NADH-quinone oxidoreductase subunit NuoH [Planctomycetota bacterium]|nr:NADH-quinone oxidoreductase subunit NuoH [Planctomycetota bacterium]
MNDDLVFSIVAALVKIIVFTHIVLIVAAYAVLAERKVSAWMQDRLGPNRVGPVGLLQPIADALKFFFKEDVVPGHVDKVIYVLAPAIALMPALIVLAVIPYGPAVTVMGRTVPMVIADLDVGILFVFAISSLGVYGIALAGWASNSKYSLLGGVRASAQMISYEVGLGLSVVGIFMVTESLRLTDVIVMQANGTWFVFSQPIAFVVFVICAFAETNRLPFDLPEAETELVAGYHTEYSSMKFAMFFIGEYAAMFVFSALVAVLFLGGWDIPFMSQASFDLLGNWGALLGFLSFITKVLLFLFFYIWVRWTIPRFRFDQLMKLGWQVLLPLALLNIVITGFLNLP